MEEKLTFPQAAALHAMLTGRDVVTMVSRKGGAIFRMLDRLEARNLIDIHGDNVTDAGKDALATYRQTHAQHDEYFRRLETPST